MADTLEDSEVRCSRCGFICKVPRDGEGKKGHRKIACPEATAEAISAGDTILTVDSTSGFKSAGDGVVYEKDTTHAESFTYTSKSATVFSGLSPFKYDHDAGRYVLQSLEIAQGSGCPLCGEPAFLGGDEWLK